MSVFRDRAARLKLLASNKHQCRYLDAVVIRQDRVFCPLQSPSQTSPSASFLRLSRACPVQNSEVATDVVGVVFGSGAQTSYTHNGVNLVLPPVFVQVSAYGIGSEVECPVFGDWAAAKRVDDVVVDHRVIAF